MHLRDDNTNAIGLFCTPHKIFEDAMICNISFVLLMTKEMIDVGHSVGRPVYCPFLYCILWFCIPANAKRGRYIHLLTLTV